MIHLHIWTDSLSTSKYLKYLYVIIFVRSSSGRVAQGAIPILRFSPPPPPPSTAGERSEPLLHFAATRAAADEDLFAAVNFIYGDVAR